MTRLWCYRFSFSFYLDDGVITDIAVAFVTRTEDYDVVTVDDIAVVVTLADAVAVVASPMSLYSFVFPSLPYVRHYGNCQPIFLYVSCTAVAARITIDEVRYGGKRSIW